MRVTFVQKQMFAYMGVMALSGILRKLGYETEVIISASEPDLVAAIRSTKPDVIGFSVLSTEHIWMEKTAKGIKAEMPGIPVVAGGVHPTLYPDDVINIPAIDYVCVGEGETVFPMLLEHLAAGGSEPRGIEGIGYKNPSGEPVLQGTARLADDLDAFVEDRNVYYRRYVELASLPLKYFVSSRGCPFTCAFCANKHLMRIFQGKGKYIRRKSARRLIDEIKGVRESFRLESVVFSDDLFVSSAGWLEEFANIYRAEIGLPFFCTARADILDERHVRALALAGCTTVSMGIETGNERLRSEVLQKLVTNERIERAAALVRGAGIRLQTSNMFCLPGETIADAEETIEFNSRIGTDFMYNLVFLPYPKTDLAELCIREGCLNPGYSWADMPESFIVRSVLKMNDLDTISNIHKVAYLCLKYPWTKPTLLKLARKFKAAPFFFMLYLFGTFIRYRDEKNLSFFGTMQFLWTFRKGY